MNLKEQLTLLFWILALHIALARPSVNWDTTITSLRFIDEFDITFNQNFQGTTIGGLSGIDYDPGRGVYYLISDDRSAFNPVRFYQAKIVVSSKKIDTVRFLEVQTIFQPDGLPFPSVKQDAARTVDPESIRYNRKAKALVWTSEGERSLDGERKILTNPAISVTSMDGTFMYAFTIPPNLEMTSSDKGPRRNGTLEGISFDDDYKTLYSSLEEPRYEDGPPADVVPTKSWIRIYTFDVKSKTNIAQYAYPLEPVAFPTSPPNAFKVNGVSEILCIGKKQLLTVERSFSTGRLPCTVKVFLTDIRNAEDVSARDSLTRNPPTRPATKKLLLNMDNLPIYIDNIEGVTFGPDLPNGHKTLLFLSDNNFSPFEKTQVLLFEVIP